MLGIHAPSQVGGSLRRPGWEKLIQEQHGCRQEQRNADAGHGGAPLERDGGGDGNKCQDNAGKYAGDPDVPFRLQASEVPGVCRAGLDEFLRAGVPVYPRGRWVKSVARVFRDNALSAFGIPVRQKREHHGAGGVPPGNNFF